MGIYFIMVFFAGKFFKGKIYKSQEKEINNIIYERTNISNICELFANISHLTNIIPIPICKFGIQEPFLFLFVQKVAPQIYS